MKYWPVQIRVQTGLLSNLICMVTVCKCNLSCACHVNGCITLSDNLKENKSLGNACLLALIGFSNDYGNSSN